VRDFDEHRTYQDLIDKIDYFKSLNINAIELMPVMEFEGNESWGYNTVFHLALDKFYDQPLN
jgi:1,4-alpha-glucan branching enzyme